MTAPRRFHDGAFTPRLFPVDPFDREPWSLNPAALPPLNPAPTVILVLGEPPLDAIAPLLHSSHLAASLLILASSRPYSIPDTAAPAVRLLHLGVPLASSDSPASRLVAVLQWADRTACAWRAQPRPPRLQELTEDGATAGYSTPPNRASWFGTGGSSSSSALPSPASSGHDLALPLVHSPSAKRATALAPERNHAQRAFDALFDFLPPDAPDRHLLKHAILVTTMSRPFLTSTAPSHPPVPTPTKSRRFSLRGRPAPPKPAAHPPAPTPAHVVHLIPPARAALIHPLESFCLSFSFPSANTSSRSAPALGLLPTPPRIDIGQPGPVPRPYIMPPAALGDVLHVDGAKWSLAELVLCGALDRESLGDGMAEMGVLDKGKGKRVSLHSLASLNRAWLNGVGDLILDGARRDRVVSDQSLPRPRSVVPSARLNGASSEARLRPTSVAQSSPPRRPSPLESSISSSSHSHSSHSHSHYGWHTDTDTTVRTPPVPAWPTPPSSASSSPELEEDKGKRSRSRSTGTGTGTIKMRKALFAWMRR